MPALDRAIKLATLDLKASLARERQEQTDGITFYGDVFFNPRIHALGDK